MKPKINCFRYKMHNDIYISNVNISYEHICDILNKLLIQRVVVIIESEENLKQVIVDNNIQDKIKIHKVSASGVVLDCNISELIYVLKNININNLDELFVADLRSGLSVTEEFVFYLEKKAGLIVKNSISDIAISINFYEKEVVISACERKYSAKSIVKIVKNTLLD